MESIAYTQNKTKDFFYKANLYVYIFGFPNFWIEELNFSKRFTKIYNYVTKFSNALIYILILFELASFLTQHNLSEKQRFNLFLYVISHPILYVYRLILMHHRSEVRSVFYNLSVAMKKIHNDPDVETQMIKKSIIYVSALAGSCVLSVMMYTWDACMDVASNNGTFTTLITAYPDVHDRSALADAVRIICYVTWWIFITRIVAVYILVIPLVTCLSHQYKHLQNYFYTLNDIFDKNELNQNEKEELYENQFKVGIKFHADTLRCTEQIQKTCSGVFSLQIVFNIVLLVILMAQSVQSERNLPNLCASGITASSILIGTGFFMWNAGDVTVEASHLSTAIYFSGWHNCQGRSSTRVRKLVTITMNHAQRPVVLKGLGYIGLSYQSYLRIVKSSYSVFSVMF